MTSGRNRQGELGTSPEEGVIQKRLIGFCGITESRVRAGRGGSGQDPGGAGRPPRAAGERRSPVAPGRLTGSMHSTQTPASAGPEAHEPWHSGTRTVPPLVTHRPTCAPRLGWLGCQSYTSRCSISYTSRCMIPQPSRSSLTRPHRWQSPWIAIIFLFALLAIRSLVLPLHSCVLPPLRLTVMHRVVSY